MRDKIIWAKLAWSFRSYRIAGSLIFHVYKYFSYLIPIRYLEYINYRQTSRHTPLTELIFVAKSNIADVPRMGSIRVLWRDTNNGQSYQVTQKLSWRRRKSEKDCIFMLPSRFSPSLFVMQAYPTAVDILYVTASCVWRRVLLFCDAARYKCTVYVLWRHIVELILKQMCLFPRYA